MTLKEHVKAGHTVIERAIDNYGTDGAVALYLSVDNMQGFIVLEGSELHTCNDDGVCDVCGDTCSLYDDYDYDNSEVIF